MADSAFFTSVGRRKTSSARVKLASGSGVMTVNGKPINEYFNGLGQNITYLSPFQAISQSSDSFNVEAKVVGGGVEGQLEAFVLGVSRALLKINPEFRAQLKPLGLLSRDSRMKESRKYGRAGKARKMKSSPKR